MLTIICQLFLVLSNGMEGYDFRVQDLLVLSHDGVV